MKFTMKKDIFHIKFGMKFIYNLQFTIYNFS